MTQRRRFFPSRPVQQIPGRTVELAVQLSPQGQTATADSGSGSGGGSSSEPDVIGAGWLMSLAGGDSGMEEMEDGRWLIDGTSDMLTRRSIWEGVPDLNSYDMGIEGPGFRCVEIEMGHPPWETAALVGVLQGRNLPQARWEIAWDRPSSDDPSKSEAGHQALTAGNMVWMRFQVWDGESDWGTESLTATAYCGDQQVATLKLSLNTGY